MANYYTDIPELKYHLNNPMMKRICELKERNYRDKEEFDYKTLYQKLFFPLGLSIPINIISGLPFLSISPIATPAP